MPELCITHRHPVSVASGLYRTPADPRQIRGHHFTQSHHHMRHYRQHSHAVDVAEPGLDIATPDGVRAMPGTKGADKVNF